MPANLAVGTVVAYDFCGMTHAGKFAVTTNEEGYRIVTTIAGEGYALYVEPGKPLVFTDNAAVTHGAFMNEWGRIHKVATGVPIEAWDDGQFLYIRVRGGHVHKFCLIKGRKYLV